MILFFSIFSQSLSEAVVFSTSARWFNYRHSANAFDIANVLKTNKLNSEFVFLGVGENPVHNVRNPFPGKIFIDDNKKLDVYTPPNITDDSLDVTKFKSILLRGPFSHNVSPLKVIEHGKMLLYITGHGGDEFFKFREVDQMRAEEFAEIVDEMKRVLKFDELLIIVDTCEAISFVTKIKTPNVTVFCSSNFHEKSLSAHYDTDYHIPLSDMFTYYLCKNIRDKEKKTSLFDLISSIKALHIGSTPVYYQFNCTKSLKEMTIEEWFYPD